MDDNRAMRAESGVGTLPNGCCAPLAFPYVPVQKNDPERYSQQDALRAGTLFPGLNLPFHAQMKTKFPAVNTALSELMALDFAIDELGLYLTTHPEDTEVLNLLLPPEAVETSVSAPTGKTVWVIDAGHGGEDGGAVAADGSKESDMNLAIARRLDALLVFLGEETRMTRTEDISIHDASASTLREKKRSDLENRVGLVNSTQGAILVSIHQNSLPSSKQTHGAQVFYGKKEGSAEVANAVQLALNQTVNAGNEKTEKAIDASIFLMKNVTAPAILIECGFLSNENETALLKSGEYQQRLAVVIAFGLLQQQ